MRTGASMFNRLRRNLIRAGRRLGAIPGHIPAGPYDDRTYFDREFMPAAHVFGSECCRAEHFLMPLFAHWVGQLGWKPMFHRKLWEFVYILQVLHERGYLREGARGLGFAVGQEPLPDYFSSLGVQVTATDLEKSEGIVKGWALANELAFDKQTLYRGISRREQFDKNVQFRPADMNAIPEDLEGYDFCWSACALEHLGSIEAGKTFLAASLKTLCPGGLSVHTTEFNVKSDWKTVDNNRTVIFRKRDLRDIAAQLRDAGHMVAPLNFYSGSHRLDEYVDLPPYRDDCHLKLELHKYATTSFGIVIQKRLDAAPASLC